jgi:hypothetical protein
VGSQLGRAFDEVAYRGEPGLCPLCHLSVVVVNGDDVECATCGAGGRLVVVDGAARITFDRLTRSVALIDEKRAHFAEVQETAAAQGPLAEEIARRAAAYAEYDRRITPQSGRRAIA